jgi:predicted metalloprotease with PDZ domain
MPKTSRQAFFRSRIVDWSLLSVRFTKRLFIPSFFAISFLLLSATTSRATIQYQISLAHPEQHTFHIKMTIPDVKDSVTVQMPAWNALYEIRDFASHLREVTASKLDSATNQFNSLPVEKLDKQTWRVTGSGTITVQYDTFWDEPGPFSAQLNSEHAFFNPALILMYVPGRRNEEIVVVFAEMPDGWTLPTSPDDGALVATRRTVWTFQAPTYDELVDSAVEVGTHRTLGVSRTSPDIFMAVDGKLEHPDAFQKKLAAICKYELALMGGVPFERYEFIFHIGDNVGGGGMEHANGTAIAARNEEGALTIAAHEFFHLWNVKRIRPASLEPVDYTKEQYTKSLWFAEGVTSTYERYTLVRTGLWPKAHFYADLGREISELEARPANKWQSAEQSSLDTWFEKYAIYNQPDHSVSYYTKGAVIGVLLDLWIREQTNNSRSLDDMMRALNEQFGKTGKPYRDREDLEAVCSQTAKASCKEFFDNYVSGTRVFPYDEYFGFAGLKIRRVVHSSAQIGTQTAFEISEDDAANEKQKRIRGGMLAGTTDKSVAATAK